MDIIRFSPGCKDLSGDYWIELANGTAVEVSSKIYNIINNNCMGRAEPVIFIIKN